MRKLRQTMIAPLGSYVLVCYFGVAVAETLQPSPVDPGESAGQTYWQQQSTRCTTSPKFGPQAVAVGDRTGDPEKDTVALPIIAMEPSCPPAAPARQTAPR